MEDLSIRDARAKLGDIIDRIKEGEVISIKGVEIGLVHAGTQLKEESGTQVVHSMSDEEIERIAVRFANVIYPKLNNAKEREIEKKVAIKQIEDVRHEDPKPQTLVMVHKWRVEPDCFADEKYDWVPYPAHLVVKGVETRPYVEEEKIELPMYDLGLSMNNRATSMNDGSNPIPKPVKKKKNEK